MKAILMPKFILVLILIFLPNNIYGAEFSGYLKTYLVSQDKKNIETITIPKMELFQSTLRLQIESKNSGPAWEIHYEVDSINSSERLSSYGLLGLSNENQSDNGIYRFSDLNREISKKDKHTLRQNLDRLNIQFQLNSGDLTIGRQVISLGSSRFINPVDVFLPFDIRTLNTEFRPGIDAIRFQKPIGTLGELDTGLIFGKDGERKNSAAYARISSRFQGQDFQITFVDTDSLFLLGAGIQGAIGDSGYWLEIANVTGDDDYTRASIGLDHAITDNIYIMVEYHYNAIGASSPDQYLKQYERDAYKEHGVFLLGKRYFASGLNVQISPVTALSFQAIYNQDDHSAFSSLSIERHLTDNLYLDLGYYKFFGSSRLRYVESDILLDSEYGINPNTAYLSLRYYF